MKQTTFIKKFHNRLNNHQNQRIKNLATLTMPGNPPRRLKCSGVVI